MNYDIDWNAQWQQHSPNFKDGFTYVDFQALGLIKKPEWKNDSIKLRNCAKITATFRVRMAPQI